MKDKKQRELWIVFTSQEYERANHKPFWSEIAKKIYDYADLLVINILADHIISRIKNKKYRINDHKKGIVNIERNLYLYRPMTFLRPEVLSGKLHLLAMNQIRKQLTFNIENFENRLKNILYYDAHWAKSLHILGRDIFKIYYIYDEVCLNASTGQLIKLTCKNDNDSCKKADIILTMTNEIKDRRSQFQEKIINFGNGASLPNEVVNPIGKLQKSIGFIGNFRNWIDFDLLTGLIKKRQDLLFFFAGPIEENVYDEFKKILNSFPNTVYFGVIKKEEISKIYQMIDIVIVPYKSNSHIKSTRPIKVVESIFNKTPVVTVSIDGYKQDQFIRIANTIDQFSEQINYLIANRPDFSSSFFLNFVQENSWGKKAELLINSIIKQKQSTK